MDYENSDFCEKIINEISAVFQDPELSSFEIIPMPVNENKSPVIYISHNLGLESWCIKHIYEYAHKVILTSKQQGMKYLNNPLIVSYLNCVILINPDQATFWNVRRQLFERNKLNITREFQFSAIVLTKKPKCNEAFAYRRWLFSFQSMESIDWNFEISLCERCSEKTTSNYHAWCHRQWVLQQATHLVRFELTKTEKFIRKHIYDYSCYHHRQYVLRRLYEMGHFDSDETDYRHLKEFVNGIMDSTVAGSTKVESNEDLLCTFLPKTNASAGDVKAKVLLYNLNNAACDLKFCEELKFMYTNCQAFEYHRRYVLKFMVDICQAAGHGKNGSVKCTNGNKILKMDDGEEIEFLQALKTFENLRGDEHKRWCKLFLGFEFAD